MWIRVAVDHYEKKNSTIIQTKHPIQLLALTLALPSKSIIQAIYLQYLVLYETNEEQ